jgi:hypothetical protein
MRLPSNSHHTTIATTLDPTCASNSTESTALVAMMPQAPRASIPTSVNAHPLFPRVPEETDAT